MCTKIASACYSGLTGCIPARVTNSPLVKRISENWLKYTLMVGVATSVAGVACSILAGSALLCGWFSILLATTSIGAYYLHKYGDVRRLSSVADDLRQSATTFQEENVQLRNSNRELAQNNANLRQTHAEFVRTQTEFEQIRIGLEGTNRNLTRQVTDLTIQTASLSRSATTMCNEVQNLQENIHLLGTEREEIREAIGGSLAIVRGELEAGARLRDEIATHFRSGEQQVSALLSNISQEIGKWRDSTAIQANRQELERLEGRLRETEGRIRETEGRLNETQAQYAAERALLEEVRRGLQLVLSDMRGEARATQEERQRIEALLQRCDTFLRQPTYPPFPLPPMVNAY